MTLQVIAVDPRAVSVALDMDIDLPAVAFVGIDNNEVVGSGGLAWGGRRCWLWFMVKESRPQYAVPVIRQVDRLKRKARQLGETELFTIRDTQFETSARLLKLSGFGFYAVEDGKEVFRCEI